jgi:hypothetical protein
MLDAIWTTSNIHSLIPPHVDTYRKAALEDLVPRLEEIDSQYQVSTKESAFFSLISCPLFLT